ncbi:DUF4253 domain-containing protein [Prevotella sp. KH2C16]|uniref:DUF4253 domain-containing protein n=1 Tax=Prevotella sp. KH2C16 TaxID=1855325 RepID=UPI0008EDB3F1|nr:DUF4253 domain-containing protein [Prevotella sp. KH2C16]SFG17780.1 protein of unknown function [Prevotella sp. KH2C16]
MDLQLAIVIGLVVFFAVWILLYQRKRRQEAQMGLDLETMIDKEDWQGVCRLLRRQLWLWGAVIAATGFVLVGRLMVGGSPLAPALMLAYFVYRYIPLVKSYRNAAYNRRVQGEEQEQRAATEDTVRQFTTLIDCNYTILGSDCTDEKATARYQETLERGRKEGFWPCIAYVDEILLDSMNIAIESNDGTEPTEPSLQILTQWREKQLHKPVGNGKAFLTETLQEKKDFVDTQGEGWWQRDVIGEEVDADEVEAMSVLTQASDTAVAVLLEIPVKEPWQIFAYLPYGGWNECPETEQHMSVARYWYEQYGAVPAAIGGDTVQYFLTRPFSAVNLEETALEHFAYCEDSISQGYGSISAWKAALPKSSYWFFWWD